MNKRTFLFRIVITLLCFFVLMPMTKASGPKRPLKCVAPTYLKPGDKVALISPSYYSSMETALAAAETLRSWGYEPVIGPNVGKKYLEHYAGTVEERLADLRWALNDPDIKAIICLRGGYSTLHLVEVLPLKELAASPKWLIGYSDITTLLSMEACAGVMSIHGVMGCNITGSGSVQGEQSRMLLRDLLKGQVPRYELPAHKENIPGRATGTLVGGNFATFVPLLGTQADALNNTDIILFVEEVEETHHNIDRLFNMLKMSGVLERCKGIILGDFTDCKNDVGYESVEAMLHEYIAPYNIPLLCGFPAGHEKVNLPLVMGAPVTLDVRADGATLIFDIPGKQQMIQPREITFQDGEFAECLDIQPSKDTILVKLHWRFIESELIESSLAELDSVLQTLCSESNRFELTYWDYTFAEASSYPGARRGAFLYQRMESLCPNSYVTKVTIKHEIIERFTEQQPDYRVLMICPVRE